VTSAADDRRLAFRKRGGQTCLQCLDSILIGDFGKERGVELSGWLFEKMACSFMLAEQGVHSRSQRQILSTDIVKPRRPFVSWGLIQRVKKNALFIHASPLVKIRPLAAS
jgi:hypothetical protein